MKFEDDGKDVYDHVKEAYEKLEVKANEETIEEAVVEEVVPPTGTEQEKPPEVEVPTAEPDEEGQWTQDKAPQSWTPTAREKWNTIPEELRKEIVRREEASVQGIRSLQESSAPLQTFVQEISPTLEYARSLGVAPQEYIRGIAQSENLLRTADLPTKFEEILRIADQYGIPLKDIINKSVGSDVLVSKAPPPIAPEVSRELEELKSWRHRYEQDAASKEIETFSKDKEFFNDVRGVMGDLVRNGISNTLEDAYDRACWMIPEVRAVLLDRGTKAATNSSVSAKQLAASNASLRSTGKVAVAVADDDNDEGDTLSDVRKAFNALSAKRI